MLRVLAHPTAATLLLTSGLLLGCQSQSGPWSGQAYQEPNRETPVQQVVVTPGVRLPFEQRLPAGNQHAARPSSDDNR